VKAHPPIHGRTHAPGGSDPLPLPDFAYMFDGSNSPVAATSTELLSGWLASGAMLTSDPYPDTVDYIAIRRQGIYICQAEAHSYYHIDSSLQLIFGWYEDDGTPTGTTRDPFVAMLGDKGITSDVPTGHRYYAIGQYWIGSIPDPATHGRLSVWFHNGDASARNVTQGMLSVVRIVGDGVDLDGPGWRN
jgi:hypothetical protein